MQPWLAETYATHRRGLYALALSITRRPELAEDAVHDAFTKMIRLNAAPHGDPASYAFGAVRNAALDQCAKQAQPGAAGRGFEEGEAHPLDFAQAPASSDPGSRAQDAEDKARVQVALASLPPEDREVILMRLWSNLSFQQIGDACREPLGTIASRYYRALAQLKLRLAETASSDASSPDKRTRHAS